MEVRQNCQFVKEVKGQFQTWAQTIPLREMTDCLGKKFKARAGEMAQYVKFLLGIQGVQRPVPTAGRGHT